jgi:hypothetical protein
MNPVWFLLQLPSGRIEWRPVPVLGSQILDRSRFPVGTRPSDPQPIDITV